MILLLFVLLVIGLLLYAKHSDQSGSTKKPKSKLREGTRKPADFEDHSIREKSKQDVEDPTTEDSLSIRNEQSLSIREQFSMPNGNNNNVTVKTEVKTDLKNNGKEVSAAPISPPLKAQQNGITQSSIQPSPGLNTMMGALTTKTAAQGPNLAAHGRLPNITAPDSLYAPPTAIPQPCGAETKRLTTTNLSPPPVTKPPLTALAAPPSQYSRATPLVGAAAMNNADKCPVISTTVPPRTASPGTPVTGAATATAIYPVTTAHPTSPGPPVAGAVTPTVKQPVISTTIPPRTASPALPLAGAATATAIYPVTAAPTPPPASPGTPVTGAVTPAGKEAVISTMAPPCTASPGPPLAGVTTKPEVATSGLSVTGNPLTATAVNPTVLQTAPVTKAGPVTAQAQADKKTPAAVGKTQQPEKASSESASSTDSLETAMSISTIPEAERAKYSFLNGRDKKVEVSHAVFTHHQEDDTLAMHDLDLYGTSKKQEHLRQLDMKPLHDYFAKAAGKASEQPVSSTTVSRTTTSSLPEKKKKKKHKRKKSPILKAVFRDKKKKTGIKTPPPAQKA